MTKEQEILKRINILIYQLIETTEGHFDMSKLKESSDEIDTLIDDL